MTLLPQIGLLVALLMASAFFSGTESALFSLSGSTVMRFRESPKRRERAVARLLSDRQTLLISILLGNLIVNLAATGRATHLLVEKLGEGAGSWIAWFGMTLVILVVGEITPKVFAVRHAAAWTLQIARPMSIFSWIVFPVRYLVIRLISPMVSQWGIEQGYDIVGLAELRTAVDEGHKAGEIHEFEGDLISALLDLEELRVKEIMTPRIRIEAVEAQTPVQDLMRGAWRMRRTRLPVYEDSKDRIIGVLHLKHLAGMPANERRQPAKMLIQDILYVPANLAVSRLLLRFKLEEKEMAVVLDEYGSVAGLVTLQDIINEIFGPLPNRHDPVSPALTPLGNNRWMIPGTCPLDELSEHLDAALEDPEVETIGGLVTKQLGKIPVTGERVELPDGVVATVMRADARRVITVEISITSHEEIS